MTLLHLTITRQGEKILPKGSTILKENDEVLIVTTYQNATEEVNLYETYIDKSHEWLNKKIREINLPNSQLIALIKRKNEYFVPNGATKIELCDTIIFYDI